MTLARHDTSNIKAFELHLIRWIDDERFIRREWISFALHHNVTKIFPHGNLESGSIPHCIFRSKSLVILDLVVLSSILEKVENIFSPNLRELHLSDLIIDEDAIEVLLPSFPSLEYMSITCCDFLSKSLTIVASRLQKLIIIECELLEYNSLKLQAPMPLELTLVDSIVEEYEFLSRAFDIRSVMETTSVSKLRRLTLHIQPIRKHTEILLHILSTSPNLQELNTIVAEISHTVVHLAKQNHQIERWILLDYKTTLLLLTYIDLKGSNWLFVNLRLYLTFIKLTIFFIVYESNNPLDLLSWKKRRKHGNENAGKHRAWRQDGELWVGEEFG
ncbi:hypothetical protein M9H77_28147 [Catharanthus roseus]|uniref:Uncharacterized protein n=1 Tax=Catharanthus roseus TaxID=4058 RepID=A0ACC0AGQ3_CATRO|nr:hypothetical protein M9H77_28147 [Catharanthus roseus]